MKLKGRRKSGRLKGSKSHARGFKKKARGSGHRGGFGMAGTGKRGDQKKTLILNLFGNDYFGKDRALRRGTVALKPKVINLQYIADNLASLVKKGLAKESKGSYALNLPGYKILGEGDVKVKLNLKAKAVSQSAKDKVEKAGGSIEVEDAEAPAESAK